MIDLIITDLWCISVAGHNLPNRVSQGYLEELSGSHDTSKTFLLLSISRMTLSKLCPVFYLTLTQFQIAVLGCYLGIGRKKA